MTRTRLADKCGSRILRCSACTGSSAVANACIGAARQSHVERGDRAVLVIDHGRREVRREILDPIDGLLHRIPTAHGVEHRVADAVHGCLARIRSYSG